ncbi:MAG: hypothetical protein AAFR36_00725 [Bacteroidota bacterium]
MNNLLDEEESTNKRLASTTNHKWASAYLAIFLVISVVRNVRRASFNSFQHDTEAFQFHDLILSIISLVVFLIGSFYAFKAYRNNEPKTKSYYFGVCGHLLLLGVSIFLLLINMIAMNT